MIELNLQKRKKLTDIENEPMVAGGEDAGRDSQGVWDGHVYTAIFKMDNQQGPTVQHRELFSILCNNLNGKRFEKEQIYIYMYN